jgi:uncharacterized protein
VYLFFYMKSGTFLVLFLLLSVAVNSQYYKNTPLSPGFELHFNEYIDSLKVIDSHEHLFNPDMLKGSMLLDFSMLLLQNSFDDLVSAGMPKTTTELLFDTPSSPGEKWKIIEPYWNKSFNTNYNRILLLAVKKLYAVNGLNEFTVDTLSSKMRRKYNGDWFNHVLKDLCKIDYIIQDDSNVGDKKEYFRYTEKFSSWLNLRTKYQIDSLAVSQIEPIYSLEDLVNSMSQAFDTAVKRGIVAVKIDVAYKRSLSFSKVSGDVAKKVFRTLVNGNEDFELSVKDAKPLQDYLLYKLLDMAKKQNLPVAFHTGLQAGNGNMLENSDPELLINLFTDYPDINFVLFHGSYPYGGTLSAIVKNFQNVYIDMNWSYAISSSYTERYLNEWLETVPVSKIMAFGGDQRCVENTYGQLILAKRIISDVLINKIRKGYISESEAKTIARMILHDNAMNFYHLR